MVRGRDIHNYNKRYRENLRPAQHRLRRYEQLPPQAGIRFLNGLPEEIKSINDLRNTLYHGMMNSSGKMKEAGANIWAPGKNTHQRGDQFPDSAREEVRI
ncbi:hypothetical protein J6590_080275 [Homalodisca vitripennis]|nr:hypothetical protein J6590_080275 [Homalodisca vitripennis]